MPLELNLYRWKCIRTLFLYMKIYQLHKAQSGDGTQKFIFIYEDVSIA
jgi:hypothetical protein